MWSDVREEQEKRLTSQALKRRWMELLVEIFMFNFINYLDHSLLFSEALDLKLDIVVGVCQSPFTVTNGSHFLNLKWDLVLSIHVEPQSLWLLYGTAHHNPFWPKSFLNSQWWFCFFTIWIFIFHSRVIKRVYW